MDDWSPDFELTVGDDKVPMDFAITDFYGAPVDLTGATIRWKWGPKNGGVPAVTSAADVTGTTPGTKARYVWLAADTVAAGNFEGQYLITLAGATEAFAWPRGRSLQIQIGAGPA